MKHKGVNPLLSFNPTALAFLAGLSANTLLLLLTSLYRSNPPLSFCHSIPLTHAHCSNTVNTDIPTPSDSA